MSGGQSIPGSKVSLQPLVPEISCAETTDVYGRFVAQPLERGFGITLGNALRRVLLSALPGAAVTWVRIEGVQHEFTALPHMKEDIIEFLLNVRAIRLRPLTGSGGRLYLEMEGEGRVTAADIIPSANFEIVNPELHLATLDSAEARLSVEFNVELGRGYRTPVPGDNLPLGAIPVDAIFTPIRKVNYEVQPLHIGRETGQERLILEVWTDGTISAVDAVSQGAEILSQQVSQFKYLALVSQKEAEKQLLRRSIPEDKYNKPVEELGLSTRTLNCLRRGGISTVGQLLERSEAELFALRSFGQKAKAEVQERLEALGLGALLGDKGQAVMKAALEAEGGRPEGTGPRQGDSQ
ncbi:MAG TPA: DNA-directed RNA polymerase subunit alpha [Dehalococcoidia bacterium]|nr:DNA-directed RNA polymerase subunit alpha [Dehalococcoidia bacterium]